MSPTLFHLCFFIVGLIIVSAQPPNCTAIGEALCTADGNCAAFGIYGDGIQLHGCVTTVANADWTIYVRNGTGYSRLPGNININENACPSHPKTGMQHSCSPPPPPPAPPLYTKVGAIDVGTFENTIFYWSGRLYNIENIPCSYWDHAGIWDPSWGNHSYARIRDFETGVIISNISSTIGFGFMTAFTDYETGIVWIFGTPADRCQGNGRATSVQSWWSVDLVNWDTALAFDFGHQTYNVQVVSIAPAGGSTAAEREVWGGRHAANAGARASLPPMRYAMVLECFNFAFNNNADGNLTYGWSIIPNTTSPPSAPCGGPSLSYSPLDDHFYFLTGGNEIFLYRTLDFHSWQESQPSPYIAPSAGDALVSPFSGFPAASTIKGSPPNRYVGVPEDFPHRPFVPYWTGANWTSWSHNNNDADQCCYHVDVNTSYLIWGASTQGGPPSPPLTGTDAGTNSVATADMPLALLLEAYFANASLPVVGDPNGPR